MGQKNHDRMWKWRLLLFPASQLVLLWFGLFRHTGNEQTGTGMGIIAVLLCVFSDIALYLALRVIQRNAEDAVRAETERQRVSMHEEYYEKTAAYYERLRTLRHDAANHIYTLRILLREGRFEEAASYAHALKKEAEGK